MYTNCEDAGSGSPLWLFKVNPYRTLLVRWRGGQHFQSTVIRIILHLDCLKHFTPKFSGVPLCPTGRIRLVAVLNSLKLPLQKQKRKSTTSCTFLGEKCKLRCYQRWDLKLWLPGRLRPARSALSHSSVLSYKRAGAQECWRCPQWHFTHGNKPSPPGVKITMKLLQQSESVAVFVSLRFQ